MLSFDGVELELDPRGAGREVLEMSGNFEVLHAELLEMSWSWAST